jgi:ATP-dependent 26S proteasome regulatory subunit
MEINIGNLPDFSDNSGKAIFNSRISNAINEVLSDQYKIKNPKVTINAAGNAEKKPDAKTSADDDSEKLAPLALQAEDPKFTFDQIILEESIIEEMQYSIKFESVREKVYEEWGLKKIEPSPKLALNFWGDSGTGKTMAAHTIAHAMGRKIILASYAEIESKYHGDGPKNVKQLFKLASDSNAVLFIDEADSLLSRRLTNVTQGSEQAINSMRSQLLIQIEQFSGVVIFATNLASNYDSAFITRIKSIHFKKPDQPLRQKLWEKMLLSTLPLDPIINIEQLAAIEDVCGRDIKNAVVKAAIKTAIDGEHIITQKSLEDSMKAIVDANREVAGKLSTEEKKEIGKQVNRQIHKDKIQRRQHFR